MLSEKCFVVFYVFSFPPGVYVGTLNLIASIPGPSILTLSINLHEHVCFDDRYKIFTGGPRGRVVKVADFSALDHSIISPMWVREFICETSHVLLAGVSGGFSPGTPVFAPPTD